MDQAACPRKNWRADGRIAHQNHPRAYKVVPWRLKFPTVSYAYNKLDSIIHILNSVVSLCFESPAEESNIEETTEQRSEQSPNQRNGGDNDDGGGGAGGGEGLW